jgi:hypothetical protein
MKLRLSIPKKRAYTRTQLLRAPRKPAPHRRPSPSMQQLRALPRDVLARLFELTNELSARDWRARLAQEHGIHLSSDSQVTTFRDWWWTQHKLEERNRRVEQFEDWFKSRYPATSPEDLRAAVLAFSLAEAALEGDRRGVVQVARTQIADESERRAREEFEFNAAEACLKHLAALRAIAADPTLDESAKLAEVRKRLFGAAP